ncbi:hypothetical protein BZA70DRAFT_136139 [Myxozyma melibiosi]|uniref:Uncharacterized protein n=1 Tax=Myxozyma melibiosi TaxID=54550 RepID=A0ABR1F9F0_9ASCO
MTRLHFSRVLCRYLLVQKYTNRSTCSDPTQTLAQQVQIQGRPCSNRAQMANMKGLARSHLSSSFLLTTPHYFPSFVTSAATFPVSLSQTIWLSTRRKRVLLVHRNMLLQAQSTIADQIQRTLTCSPHYKVTRWPREETTDVTHPVIVAYTTTMKHNGKSTSIMNFILTGWSFSHPFPTLITILMNSNAAYDDFASRIGKGNDKDQLGNG